MKVLIATDGSVDSGTAMNTAVRLLRKDHLHVDVLCVSSELVLAGGFNVLERAQRDLRRQGIQARGLIDVGSPGDDIPQIATDYDVVVAGAHGKSERTQPGLGPVSSKIVDQSNRTVLVGRELLNEGPYRVLVALDGSERSFEALATLGRLLDLSALDLTLMHVVETSWTRSEDTDESEGDEYGQKLQHELRAYAETVIDRGERLIEQWGIPTTVVIEEGDPALELTSHAEEGNYDLIVVGATGRSDVKHALLGSVSLNLAWNAPCSVLVVRSGSL